ncbi:multifunctional oxoglutarate decarboxylase/oxoglutarate dehydrogenase thiamine pyrophosphate-binding subunit/dihydrolipoyllysine-residue succinyltransferase subunit [Ignavibacterium sp.]|uniref:multifunctional oxoglutarate decarboxylase/oxoglutarate dehydrogenase thiamine pyrophosphate-binding subunit/dihydrolipoyllysine-residue succinyltransferase subunit n=1 Tax=Ignavibacterium sp. TaxID=2651167 RepID=UPI0021FC01BF|nr:multifunctional oxoglutarate decarboxylase/oxoglutarate dehydrogenase thiamine pyrophosphate-binding subunit/dihydrolipoyllysine-residue succinyltransferase subunit [Ignavibacterium sp.]BDQ01561.1 MAG: alpha-ketoglutarate decarboxylase [Ignavibacterium sp.]
MKKEKLSKKEIEELEKFGANTWFVEYLYKQYEQKPDEVPEQWRKFFGNVEGKNKSNGSGHQESLSYLTLPKNVEFPKPSEDDELKVIAGSAQRILDNMTSSLTIPVATSQRTIPVKLLEENRILINQHLQKRNLGKVSFTHIISWAILKAIKKIPAMNNAFTIIDGKPNLIVRKNVNLGLAIDIERKDGSRSLLVPNIKNANKLSFKEFLQAYEDIVERSRKGTIDPSEFLGTTITLTNPGTIGTVSSIPRLMIGQGAIIAIGAIQYNAEYQAMSPTTISALGISKVMNITSTYDHRIIQGAESGLFLKEINELLLGKDRFYEEIFDELKVTMRPLQWETDYQPGGFDKSSSADEIVKQAKVLQLINLYRVRGHLIADLDPLGSKVNYHPELDPSSFNLTVWDLDREFITGGFGGLKTATLRQILTILHKTYCEKIGVEYMHIQSPAEKVWLQSKMEPSKNTPDFDSNIKKHILKKLIQAESFEHFLHNRFIGHKRFSLEGSETLIPVLDFLLNEAAEHNVSEAVIGMAHRGRMNVLVNIMGKSYESIFSEFEDIQDPNSIQGSGDVKYHLGATGKYKTLNGKMIGVSLSSNPSHLEWVNPVVEGIVRAKQTRLGDAKAHQKVMPILIHGDAAFAGQGVVAETLNLSQLSGYRTGGTVHIIVNNQIGFTTTPEDARSSTYATDVAKMIQAPIFHVNGDDPEAALWVTKIAFEYKHVFKKDVVIDLFGYRRHGHNEGDEPGFTQPILYDKIKAHPSVRKIYLDKLLKEGVITSEEAEKIQSSYEKELSKALDSVKKKSTTFSSEVPLAVPAKSIKSVKTQPTFISEEILNKVIIGLTTLPENFNGHPKLQKFLEARRKLLDNSAKADWALAESIAFGSLLLEGTPVRLSGQDSVRGTFSQRHLALTDVKTGTEYFPLNHLDANQANLEALDSSLSEAAVLGFEYGYSTADPLALVIWEAQFGDFANSAQVIIDNFIVASFEKWNVPNSLVMLLPHGYEGQGPEHSSARIERFLILCAEENMHVCNVTTPVQYFHLLRRQIKYNLQKPLVIFTPKSLLRHPEAKSSKEEFLSGEFKEVLDDLTVTDKSKITRIILTSGKVYYDLKKFLDVNKIKDTAIIRLEQYYPFKSEMLKRILSSYHNSQKLVWVQEEPRNMGAWNFLWHRLEEIKNNNQKLYCVSRPEGASPAVGSARITLQQQEQLIKEAFQ